MNITIDLYPTPIALSGNSINVYISLKKEFSNESVSYQTLNFTIKKGAVTKYNGTLCSDNSGKCKINISEIIEEFISAPTMYRNEIFQTREDVIVSFSIEVVHGNDTVEHEFNVLYGRISDKLSRLLNYRSTNIFTAKFLNKQTNFLSTSRSKFYLCEDPCFLGIGTGENINIRIGDKLLYSFPTTLYEPYEIYLTKLAIHGEDFNFYIGDTYSFTLSLLQDPLSSCQTIIDYKNNFGISEKIICIGTGTISAKTQDNDELTEYDEITDSYISRAKKDISEDLILETGYLSSERIQSIRECLSSDEVYIIRNNVRERVNISSTANIPYPYKSPISIALNISLISGDHGYSQDISFLGLGGRIHTDTFNACYN